MRGIVFSVITVVTGLDVVGIYRLSGNAAQIQKLRHRTDQGTYACINVCVYCGCVCVCVWVCVCVCVCAHFNVL